MFWEHEGNAAVRIGNWKLVRNYPGPWELYDLDADRTELHDLAGQHPERVQEMSVQYDAWASRCGVLPREKVLAMMKAQTSRARFLGERGGAVSSGGQSRKACCVLQRRLLPVTCHAPRLFKFASLRQSRLPAAV